MDFIPRACKFPTGQFLPPPPLLFSKLLISGLQEIVLHLERYDTRGAKGCKSDNISWNVARKGALRSGDRGWRAGKSGESRAFFGRGKSGRRKGVEESWDEYLMRRLENTFGTGKVVAFYY